MAKHTTWQKYPNPLQAISYLFLRSSGETHNMAEIALLSTRNQLLFRGHTAKHITWQILQHVNTLTHEKNYANKLFVPSRLVFGCARY